eukprot:gene1215-1609_t
MPDKACCNARLGRILLASAAVAALAACGSLDGASRRVASVVTPYKIDIVQGNFVSREQVLGRTSQALNLWASPHEHTRLLHAVLRNGQAHQLPMRAQRPDGSTVSGLTSARPVHINGQEGFVFVFHDMTEAERTSEELKTRNGLLQQAGRLARLGAWEHDLTKGLLYWSDMCFEIHALPVDSPLPDNYIEKYVPPEYQVELRQKFRDCIDHQQEWSMDLEIVLHS